MTTDRVLLFVVLSFLVYRLSRLVTRDSITNTPRLWLWKRAYTEGNFDSNGNMRYLRQSWFWWAIYEWADCIFCNSVWFAALSWWAWWGWPWFWVRPMMELGAVMGGAAFIASRKDA